MTRALDREKERLGALRSLDLEDAVRTDDFNAITRLAAAFFDAPIALISLVGAHRQTFLSEIGLGMDYTPVSISICAHALEADDVFDVPDLTQDARFRDSPLVTGTPHMRAYAGARLVVPPGHAIGALCVIATHPRPPFNDEQCDALKALARLTVNQIALRRNLGRRDAVSGLPNRQQYVEDMRGWVPALPGSTRRAVLMEVTRMSDLHDMARALGIGPSESLVRRMGMRLTEFLGKDAQVYHVAITRYAFNIVLPDDDPLDAFMRRLIERMNQPIPAEGVVIQPRIVCGVTAVADDVTDRQDTLRRAMVAMDCAEGSRSKWHEYTETDDQGARRRYQLATDIPRAIAENHFYLVYQPRVELASGTVTGVEALIRWRHPQLGEVMPAEFIPIVERTAAMQAVTFWVIDAALKQLRQWQAVCPRLHVSINLSACDLADDRLLPALVAACHLYDVAPERVEVEVTEGEWLHQNSSITKTLVALRAAGIAIAIDDFGAGYSNFAYLNEIPATHIKLDQSLIRNVAQDERLQMIVKSIVVLSRRLRYRTVAEGVEDARALALLTDWACDEAQGYYIARPMPAAQVPAFIQTFSVQGPSDIKDASASKT